MEVYALVHVNPLLKNHPLVFRGDNTDLTLATKALPACPSPLFPPSPSLSPPTASLAFLFFFHPSRSCPLAFEPGFSSSKRVFRGLLLSSIRCLRLCPLLREAVPDHLLYNSPISQPSHSLSLIYVSFPFNIHVHKHTHAQLLSAVSLLE